MASSSRQQIAAIAKDLLAGRVEPIDACRIVATLRGQLDEVDAMDSDVLAFVGVESELDEIPSSDVRELWDPAEFSKRQHHAMTYLSSVKPQLLEAARSLADRWKDVG